MVSTGVLGWNLDPREPPGSSRDGEDRMVFALSPGGGALCLLAVKKASLIPELVSWVSNSKPKKTTPGTLPAHTAWSLFLSTHLGFPVCSVFQLWMNAADNLELSLFSHLMEILQSSR